MICVLLAALFIAACSNQQQPPDTTSAPESPAHAQFQSPTSLSSYRYTIEIEASTELMDLDEAPAGLDLQGQVLRISVEGERSNPGREYSHSQSSFGPLTLERETIVIGERLWSRQAGGAWRERPILTRVEDLVGQDAFLSPAVLFGGDDPDLLLRVTDDLEARPNRPDTVRGRDARHWHLDREWLRAYERDFSDVIPEFAWPDEIDAQIWADVEERVATRILVVAATPTNSNALRLEVELFDLDDPAIKVEVPPGAIGP